LEELTSMIPYHKILIPTDGSDNTKAAIAYALKLAKLVGAEVTAISVNDTSNYATASGTVGPDVTSSLYQLCEDAVRYVVEEGARSGVTVHTNIINGNPARDIVEASKAHDLVVMGSVGRTGVAHLILGSVAQKVVRMAACPVLVVRNARPESDLTICRKLLIPTDGSENTTIAIRHGLELAKAFNAQVTALSVSLAKDPDQISNMAVEQVAEEGRKMGLKVIGSVVPGSPPEEIVKASFDHDLIVMGTAGRTGLAHLRLGSVAEHTIRGSACPVLVVRASVDRPAI